MEPVVSTPHSSSHWWTDTVQAEASGRNGTGIRGRLWGEAAGLPSAEVLTVEHRAELCWAQGFAVARRAERCGACAGGAVRPVHMPGVRRSRKLAVADPVAGRVPVGSTYLV